MSKCKTAEKVIEDIYSSYEVQEYTNKMKVNYLVCLS